jgi:hypothetical protein
MPFFLNMDSSTSSASRLVLLNFGKYRNTMARLMGWRGWRRDGEGAGGGVGGGGDDDGRRGRMLTGKGQEQAATTTAGEGGP